MFRSLLGLLALSTAAYPQGIITTVAGTDQVFPGDGKPALEAPLGKVTAVVSDSSGRIYFADSDNCIVGRINLDSTITVIAGNGFCDSSGDGGPARLAGIESPFALAIDSPGNIYVGTFFDVRKITTDGLITTVAGSASATDSFPQSGGPATQYSIQTATGLAVDSSGNLFISESIGNRVLKVTPNGILSVFAVTLGTPAGLALDDAGGLLFADSLLGQVLRVTPDGAVSILINGLPNPTGLRLDRGSLYITVPNGVLRVTATSKVIFAGTDASGFSGDGGLATQALFSAPNDVAIDPSGAVYVADLGNSRIRRIGADGIVNTIAGDGKFRYLGEGTPALATPLATEGILKATFVGTSAILMDPSGALYVSQTSGNRVSKIVNGVVTTVIGTGNATSTGDGGPAINASVSSPIGLAQDPGGNLYVWEGDAITLARIRKISPAGTVSTFADKLPCPVLATDPFGTLYAACLDATIRKFSSSGSSAVVAGQSGIPGYSGDGGPATKARLSLPIGLAIDSAGNIYVSDTGNAVIRKIDSKGIISSLTAPGQGATTGDGGPAKSATVEVPAGMALDAQGNLYIGDFDGNRVRKISTSGIITTVVGPGTALVSGDGKPATQASVFRPVSLAFDQAGDLFILDIHNNRIREVLSTTPTVQLPQTSLSLSANSGGASAHGTFSVTGSIPGLDFQIATDSTSSWLTVGSASAATPRLIDVIADPANLTPGTYHAVLTVRPSVALPQSLTVNVTLVVGPAQPARLVVDQPNLSFTFPKGATARNLAILLSNTGSGTVTFSVAATSSRISVSPLSGSVSPDKPVSIAVTGDPTSLSPGTYTDTITIKGSNGQAISIPVNTVVSASSQALLLTQSGLSFTAVAQGGVVPPQMFGVVNPGAGSLSWTASTSTLSGGNGWLSVTPSSGSSVAGSPAPKVTININQAGLAAGRYYGLVRVSAPAAPNSPQLVTVFLEVLPAGSDPGAVIQPPELTFTTTSGRPGSLELSVFGVGGSPKSFRTDHSNSDFVFEVLPADGVVNPSQPSQFVVQPVGTPTDLFEFPQGVYKGAINFQFADGSVQRANVTLISNPSGNFTGAASPGAASPNDSPNNKSGARDAGGCSPQQLQVSLQSLGQTFPISAGWPVGLSMIVQDNCGTPMRSGAVTARFSNGDPPLPLQSLNDGTWQATWQTGVTTGPVSVHVDALDPQTHLAGFRDITGNPGAQKDPPLLSSASVGSAASFVAYSPLAPGGIISIYGDRLADETLQNQSVPLPTQLSNTQVLIGGQPAPLFFVSKGQINALVPFEINPNTRQQVLVENGPTYSQPVPVDVGPAQPAPFLSSGNVIAAAYRGSTSFLVTPATPATAGDVLVIYCAGLGITDQTIADGAGSPGSPPAHTKDPVTVSFGGQSTPVQFAGLAPSFVGLYQINVAVPPGLPAGNVPLSISVSRQTGPSAPIAIQ
jgi:uncharacterized protein (TIGR03437 family)